MPRKPTVIAGLMLVPAIAAADSAIDLTFVDHISAEMIEQDVFVDKVNDGFVYRVTTEDSDGYRDADVFSSLVPVKHAPMDYSKVGPYPSGGKLGLKLGDWLSAGGSGQLTCAGGQGMLTAEFHDLVPGGLYTMWNFFAGQKLAEFHTYDLPLGAPDGSQAAFRADDNGDATYEVTFEPCLQGTTPQLVAGLAIAYHSDGETHGHEPGPMGYKSHVQLFTMLPEQDAMPQ